MLIARVVYYNGDNVRPSNDLPHRAALTFELRELDP